jgi:glycosyltransferase involved in cell wall biosynthesis
MHKPCSRGPRKRYLPFFSVVIPTYGRPAYLAEALESVTRQTLDSFEVIVVDDASPEPVVLPSGFPATLIRAETNGGAASARNLGAEAATGDILTFLDDDDRWLPSRLEDAARGLEVAPISLCGQGRRTRPLTGNVHDVVLDAMTPHLGATAIERARWKPLDASYRTCEDVVWWLEVTHDNRVSTVQRQGLEVRRHPGVRIGYGARQRIADSQRLMEEFADYFACHPRAAAFRLRRIGLMHKALGNHSEARRAHMAALRLRPNIRDAKHAFLNLKASTRRPDVQF